MTKSVLLFVVALFCSQPSVAEVYKWIDENGQVHFCGSPPADCHAEKIELPSTPVREEDAERERERWSAIIEKQKKREEIRRQDRERKKREAEHNAALLEKRCKVLRGRLFLLKQPGIVTFADDAGNLLRPSDQQREIMIQKIEAFIRENCD